MPVVFCTQSVVVGISDKMTVQEVLEGACNKRQLNPNDHFIRLKLPGPENFKIPEKPSFMENEVRVGVKQKQKLIIDHL